MNDRRRHIGRPKSDDGSIDYGEEMATAEVSVAMEGQSAGAMVDLNAARRRPSMVPGYDPLEHVTPVPGRNTTEQPVYRGPAHFGPMGQTDPGEMTTPIDTNTFARQAQAFAQRSSAARPLPGPPPRHAPTARPLVPAPQEDTPVPTGLDADEEPTNFSIPPAHLPRVAPEPRTARMEAVVAPVSGGHRTVPLPVVAAQPEPVAVASSPAPPHPWAPPAAAPAPPFAEPRRHPAGPPPGLRPPPARPAGAARHGAPARPAPVRPQPPPARYQPDEDEDEPARTWDQQTGTFQADRYEQEAIKGSPLFLFVAIGVVLAVIGAVIAFILAS